MGRSKRRQMAEIRRHPRWGASKVQAKRNQEIRELKNRIHELEQQIAGGDTPRQDFTVSNDELAALRVVASLRINEAAGLGLVESAWRIAILVQKLETRRLAEELLATGKVTP